MRTEFDSYEQQVLKGLHLRCAFEVETGWCFVADGGGGLSCNADFIRV